MTPQEDLYYQVALRFSREEECADHMLLGDLPDSEIENVKQGKRPICYTCKDAKGTMWPMRIKDESYYHGYCLACSDSECCWAKTQSEIGDCHGLGWVACTDMATLIRELKIEGAQNQMTFFKLPYGVFAVSIAGGAFVMNEDPEAALLEATLKWVESKKGVEGDG